MSAEPQPALLPKGFTNCLMCEDTIPYHTASDQDASFHSTGGKGVSL